MLTFLYRPNSEHERSVLDYARDFEKQGHGNIELVSIDTIVGAELAKTYDVTNYPALLARRENGQLMEIWQGEQLPLINNAAFYNQ